jgi:hypothetical protein
LPVFLTSATVVVGGTGLKKPKIHVTWCGCKNGEGIVKEMEGGIPGGPGVIVASDKLGPKV